MTIRRLSPPLPTFLPGSSVSGAGKTNSTPFHVFFTAHSLSAHKFSIGMFRKALTGRDNKLCAYFQSTVKRFSNEFASSGVTTGANFPTPLVRSGRHD